MMMAGERFNDDASMRCFIFHQGVKIVEGRVVIFIASILAGYSECRRCLCRLEFSSFQQTKSSASGGRQAWATTCGAGCGQDAVRDGLQSEMPEGR